MSGHDALIFLAGWVAGVVPLIVGLVIARFLER